MEYEYYFNSLKDSDNLLKNLNKNSLNCHDNFNGSLVMCLNYENEILFNKIRMIKAFLSFKKAMSYEIWKLLHDSIDELDREIRVNNNVIEREFNKMR